MEAAIVAATFASLGNPAEQPPRPITRLAGRPLVRPHHRVQPQTPVTQAGPENRPIALRPESLLPQTVGVGVPTDEAVTIPFDAAMDPGTVEAALQVLPDQPVELAWSEDLDQLTVAPERLWRTDETYLVVVGGSAARTDGQRIAGARRYSFTTADGAGGLRLPGAPGGRSTPRPAPARRGAATPGRRPLLDADALVRRSTAARTPPTTTAKAVSATSSITISFSAPMDHADVEEHFAISPGRARRAHVGG